MDAWGGAFFNYAASSSSCGCRAPPTLHQEMRRSRARYGENQGMGTARRAVENATSVPTHVRSWRSRGQPPSFPALETRACRLFDGVFGVAHGMHERHILPLLGLALERVQMGAILGNHANSFPTTFVVENNFIYNSEVLLQSTTVLD